MHAIAGMARSCSGKSALTCQMPPVDQFSRTRLLQQLR
jgi:hypothetical protein